MGYSNIEIGRILKVSENTVKSHIARIYAALDVTNRTEAALYYKESQKDRNPDMKRINAPVIILKLFSYFKTEFLDASNNDPNPIALKLQIKLLALLSKKKLFSVVKENYSTEQYNGYVLSGVIHKRLNSIDISVYLEKHPQGIHIWSNTFSDINCDLDETINWSAKKIVASLMYNLLSKESSDLMEVQLKEKNMFQNIFIGFHLVNLATEDSLTNAKKIFDYILESYPSNVSALYGKCIGSYSSIINHSQDFEKNYLIIKNCYNSISVISKDCTEVWLSQGMLNVLDKNINGAIISFQNAIRLDSSLQEAYFLLSQLYILSGDYSNGKKYLEQAISLCPDCQFRGNNLVVISIIYFCLGEYTSAVNFFEKSIYLQEGNMIGTILYICSLYYIGNVQKAHTLSKNLIISQTYIDQLIEIIDKNILNQVLTALSNMGINII